MKHADMHIHYTYVGMWCLPTIGVHIGMYVAGLLYNLLFCYHININNK